MTRPATPPQHQPCLRCKGTGWVWNVDDGLLLLPFEWLIEGLTTDCPLCGGTGYLK